MRIAIVIITALVLFSCRKEELKIDIGSGSNPVVYPEENVLEYTLMPDVVDLSEASFVEIIDVDSHTIQVPNIPPFSEVKTGGVMVYHDYDHYEHSRSFKVVGVQSGGGNLTMNYMIPELKDIYDTLRVAIVSEGGISTRSGQGRQIGLSQEHELSINIRHPNKVFTLNTSGKYSMEFQAQVCYQFEFISSSNGFNNFTVTYSNIELKPGLKEGSMKIEAGPKPESRKLNFSNFTVGKYGNSSTYLLTVPIVAAQVPICNVGAIVIPTWECFGYVKTSHALTVPKFRMDGDYNIAYDFLSYEDMAYILASRTPAAVMYSVLEPDFSAVNPGITFLEDDLCYEISGEAGVKMKFGIKFGVTVDLSIPPRYSPRGLVHPGKYEGMIGAAVIMEAGVQAGIKAQGELGLCYNVHTHTPSIHYDGGVCAYAFSYLTNPGLNFYAGVGDLHYLQFVPPYLDQLISHDAKYLLKHDFDLPEFISCDEDSPEFDDLGESEFNSETIYAEWQCLDELGVPVMTLKISVHESLLFPDGGGRKYFGIDSINGVKVQNLPVIVNSQTVGLPYAQLLAKVTDLEASASIDIMGGSNEVLEMVLFDKEDPENRYHFSMSIPNWESAYFPPCLTPPPPPGGGMNWCFVEDEYQGQKVHYLAVTPQCGNDGSYHKKWFTSNYLHENGRCPKLRDTEPNVELCNFLGRYYSYDEITKEDGTFICPQGFHIPSPQEWRELINLAGGDEAWAKLIAHGNYSFDKGPPSLINACNVGLSASGKLLSFRNDTIDGWQEDFYFWTDSTDGANNYVLHISPDNPNTQVDNHINFVKVNNPEVRFPCRCVSND